MEVEYKNASIKKVCEEYGAAVKKHGPQLAERIHFRIGQIKAAESIEHLVRFSVGRCHLLDRDRKGQYAMDLLNGYRLVFTKKGNSIHIAHILEVVDYH